MADLKLAFASQDYEHVRALIRGAVKPKGVELTHTAAAPIVIFKRMIVDKEFDFGEMGLTYYLRTLAMADPPFVAIPVFPARIFRHAAVFINSESGIRSPKDLIGRRVGEHFFYGHDAGVWAKGILSDDYGVPADSFSYYLGGVDRASGPIDWLPQRHPPHVKIQHIGATRTLDTLLDSGEVDAVFSARTPPLMAQGSPRIRRLFDNPKQAEQEYFRRTGIFPMMHTVVIRKELYRKHPWVARAIYEAFKEAKNIAHRRYLEGDNNMHLVFMTPWLTYHQLEVQRLMGDDWWPYGVEPNRAAIEAFTRYHYEQGLSDRVFACDELFVPETQID